MTAPPSMGKGPAALTGTLLLAAAVALIVGAVTDKAMAQNPSGGNSAQSFAVGGFTLVAEISDAEIEGWYEAARNAGAAGGKLLGAGSGGFLMFFAAPERHDEIRRVLPGLRPMKFGLDSNGSQIIFYRP